jgi:hypothetical protein
MSKSKKEGAVMRKMMWSAIPIILLVFVFFVPQSEAQPMGPGMMGEDPGYGSPYESEEGWRYCPYCGVPLGPGRDYRRGPGMMHRGWGMGPGMRGPGYGRGYGYGPGPHRGPGYNRGHGMWGPGYGSPYGQTLQPLKKEGARALVEEYIGSGRNPNLKVGDIEDEGPVFVVEILTKEGSLVDKLAVNKDTGWINSIY